MSWQTHANKNRRIAHYIDARGEPVCALTRNFGPFRVEAWSSERDGDHRCAICKRVITGSQRVAATPAPVATHLDTVSVGCSFLEASRSSLRHSPRRAPLAPVLLLGGEFAEALDFDLTVPSASADHVQVTLTWDTSAEDARSSSLMMPVLRRKKRWSLNSTDSRARSARW